MQHECKINVLETKCFPELQARGRAEHAFAYGRDEQCAE